MRYFPINNPVTNREYKLFYNSKSNKKDILERQVLDYWEDYCNEHWVWLDTFEPNRWNYEDKTKHFLNRCANFLLMGQYGKSDVMSGNDIYRIVENEYSLDGDWENEDIETYPEEVMQFLNAYIKDEYSGDGKMLETEVDNKPVRHNRRTKTKSRTSKMLEIYSEEGKEVDGYEEVHISNTFSVWKQAKKTIPARDGLIDKSKPYISEWCIVDTENIFEFNNNKYKINEQVLQYNIRTKKPNHDDYKSDYQMDKILVYEQDGNPFFFDQDIEQIEIDKITRV